MNVKKLFIFESMPRCTLNSAEKVLWEKVFTGLVKKAITYVSKEKNISIIYQSVKKKLPEKQMSKER